MTRRRSARSRFAHAPPGVYDGGVMRMSRVRLDPYLLLLFGLSLFAAAPLLAPGYFYDAHDGRHSVFFASMFDEAIRSGALWPRWAMHHNQGYGYPTFLLQAPLAFYVAEAFILLGLSATQAVKAAFAVALWGGAWGMYALVRTWIAEAWPEPVPQRQGARVAAATAHASMAALIAALLYTFAPYHLLDVYVRAALAETMVMAWFPWVFLAFDRLIAAGTAAGWQGRLLAAAASYAGLLLTHTFALAAFTPLLMTFALFRLWNVWRREQNGAVTAAASGRLAALGRVAALAGGAGIAALLLASPFLVPLIMEGPLLVQEEWTRDTYHYSRHWVHWGQFLSPFWGYGYSDDPAGANDGMGLQLGAPSVLLLIAAAWLLWRFDPDRRRERDRFRGLMGYLLVASLVVLALMTPGAETLWDAVPLLAVLQFPWRLLALTSFTLSALGGLALWQMARTDDGAFSGRHAERALLAIAFLVAWASYSYSQPGALQPVEPWREDGRAVMEFEQEHPDMIATTRWVDERPVTSPLTEQYQRDDFSLDALERLAVLSGEGEVLRHYSLGHAFGGEVMMATPGAVQIRLYEFPGWQVKVNGTPVAHRVSPPYGLIEVDVPAGRVQIDVWMGGTPARTTGAAISAATLTILVGLWLYGRTATRNRSGLLERTGEQT